MRCQRPAGRRPMFSAPAVHRAPRHWLGQHLTRASHFADHAAQRTQVQVRPAAEAKVMIGLRSDSTRLCSIPATRLRRQKYRSVALRGHEFVCRRTSARTAVICSAEVNSLLSARQPKRRWRTTRASNRSGGRRRGWGWLTRLPVTGTSCGHRRWARLRLFHCRQSQPRRIEQLAVGGNRQALSTPKGLPSRVSSAQ